MPPPTIEELPQPFVLTEEQMRAVVQKAKDPPLSDYTVATAVRFMLTDPDARRALAAQIANEPEFAKHMAHVIETEVDGNLCSSDIVDEDQCNDLIKEALLDGNYVDSDAVEDLVSKGLERECLATEDYVDEAVADATRSLCDEDMVDIRIRDIVDGSDLLKSGDLGALEETELPIGTRFRGLRSFGRRLRWLFTGR